MEKKKQIKEVSFLPKFRQSKLWRLIDLFKLIFFRKSYYIAGTFRSPEFILHPFHTIVVAVRRDDFLQYSDKMWKDRITVTDDGEEVKINKDKVIVLSIIPLGFRAHFEELSKAIERAAKKEEKDSKKSVSKISK